MARPLKKTYDPANPFVAERHDQEDGSIVYEIWDYRPETYRRLCVCAEDYCDDDGELEPNKDRGQTKKDADMIATALNMVYGKRDFKSAKLRTIPSMKATEREGT
jgi:hypothetical protein